jgi:hypothetical protein
MFSQLRHLFQRTKQNTTQLDMREHYRRTTQERYKKAAERINITIQNGTWDSPCPTCDSKIEKEPQVTLVVDGFPVCVTCQQKHKPKLHNALTKFYAKYPVFPYNCDFDAAIRDLEKWTGQTIEYPRVYGDIVTVTDG